MPLKAKFRRISARRSDPSARSVRSKFSRSGFSWIASSVLPTERFSAWQSIANCRAAISSNSRSVTWSADRKSGHRKRSLGARPENQPSARSHRMRGQASSLCLSSEAVEWTTLSSRAALIELVTKRASIYCARRRVGRGDWLAVRGVRYSFVSPHKSVDNLRSHRQYKGDPDSARSFEGREHISPRWRRHRKHPHYRRED